MPFQPGQSGNPAGRPRGTRNKRTIIAEKLLDDRAGDVTNAAITLATDGDVSAARACLDRVAPRLRHRVIDFPLPNLVTLADVPVAMDKIAQGLACGELNPDEGAILIKAVRGFATAQLAIEREQRMALLAAAPDDGDAPGGQSLADFLAEST